MIIPIGSWCRTAYQVNEFLKANGIKSTSFPYDWTITPFFSLKFTLSNRFHPSSILEIENIQRNQFGSITDNNTQLIHHHDFPPQKMKEIEEISELDINGIPKVLYSTDLIAKAKERFAQAYKHLEASKHGGKVLFVR
jgi:hypothetical protein